jgi:hypothetical protein
MLKNKILARLLGRSKLEQAITYCDSCAQVCDQNCQANSVLNRLDNLRTEIRLGLYR